jgi:Hemerythrin HHE cation binding domain
MAAMDERLTAFGNQLIDSHIRLRELLAGLRDGTYAGVDLRDHCLAFCSVLGRHHEAEDGEGFPVVAQHYPELRPVLAELSRDHRQIGEVLDRLKVVSTMGVGAERELDTLAALLETHLVYERSDLLRRLMSCGLRGRKGRLCGGQCGWSDWGWGGGVRKAVVEGAG